MSKREIYRILDAAANRGREALRVVEDAARFLEDDAELTARLKETRHRFAAAQNRFDRRERLDAR
ncbi:MAG: thiamine phosphate synthase, partial [Thermoguttaceae bacterium]|nr:thiamine phosphate synthase [Thermoguttaceae bacterium]